PERHVRPGDLGTGQPPSVSGPGPTGHQAPVPVPHAPAPALCFQPAGAAAGRSSGYLTQPAGAEPVPVLPFGGARAPDPDQRRDQAAPGALDARGSQWRAPAAALVAAELRPGRGRAGSAPFALAGGGDGCHVPFRTTTPSGDW